MAIFYRHGDPRFPFMWEVGPQPPARWHASSDAPASYFADTTDGAWAEFLRHEQITDSADLAGVARRLWVVEVAQEHLVGAARPSLPTGVLLGDASTYRACQDEAQRLRAQGHQVLLAPSAALLPGAARGQYVASGLHEGRGRDGTVLVLFGGQWPDVIGWAAVAAGAPTERTLSLVQHLT